MAFLNEVLPKRYPSLVLSVGFMSLYEDNHALMSKGSFGFNTMHIDREIYFPGMEEDLQI